MYGAPYRIAGRPSQTAEPDYGTSLTQEIVLSKTGPLQEQGAGDLSRWMALPWQGDTAFCRSGYDPEYDPYVPTFWPAHVPNQVLTLDDYEKVCDQSLTMDERIAAFHNRPSWLRQIPSNVSLPDQMLYMVNHFGEMGILEAKPRPDDMPQLPEMLYVENLKATKHSQLLQAQALLTEQYKALSAEEKLYVEAGWASKAQRDEYLKVKFWDRK